MPVVAVLAPIVAAIGSGAAAAGTAVAGAAAAAGTAAAAAGTAVAGAASVVGGAAAAAGSAAAGAAAAAGTAAVGAAATAGSAIAGAATAAGTAIGSTAVGSAVGSAASAAASSIVGAAATVGSAATTVGGAVSGLATTAGSAAVSAIGSTTVGAAALESAAAASAAISSAGSAIAGTAVGSAISGAASSAGALAAKAVTATVATLGTEGVAAVIAGSVLYTGSNVVTAFSNFEEADRLIADARHQFNDISNQLEAKKNETIAKLEQLNLIKVNIYAQQISKAIEIFRKITNIKQKDTDFLDDTAIDGLFTTKELRRLEKTSSTAANILQQVNEGAGLMQAASTGSLAFMAQFGIASTGTAISTLGGAAATNATLATLGGGSLAAGGGGMALGSAVLGGVTVLPAAIVLSWNYAKNSEKALTEAHRYYAETIKEIEKAKLQISMLRNGIDQRVVELSETLEKLSLIFQRQVFPRLEKAYKDNKDKNGNINYQNCTPGDKHTIASAGNFTKEMANIMRVKILDKSGKPSAASKRVLTKITLNDHVSGML